MIDFDKFDYVVRDFIPTVASPSPGVRSQINSRMNMFAVTKEDLVGYNEQDFLDLLGVYHDKKPCALIDGDISISSIIDLKQKGLFLVKTKTWWVGRYDFFVSKSESHANYMANMFTYYVDQNYSSNLFHVKMGLGLGYTKPAILSFLKRITLN